MILQSLVRYYEILAADPESGVARPGYCQARVSFAANISPEGELLALIPCKISRQQGKKTVEAPQRMLVPEQAKRAVNIEANFLCENAGYFFGLDTKGKPERTKQCFEAFCRLHQELLEGIDVPEAQAILAFLNGWDPSKAAEHPVLTDYVDQLNTGALIVFRLNGGRFAHAVAEIRAAWEARQSSVQGQLQSQCLVCGKELPISRLHPSIKGVAGAPSMGVSIVSFNAPAYESYGKEKAQGLNAPVSTYATFAYTTALNHLLSDSVHRQTVGDTTIAYWAESQEHKQYQDLFAGFENPPLPSAKAEEGAVRDVETERMLEAMFQKIACALPASDALTLNPSVRFCILGVSPNSARLAVRFFLQDSFGAFIDRIGRHYADMQLVHAPFEPAYIPLWMLLSETVPPTSRDKKPSPLLSGAVPRAILTGTAYPEALYSSVLLRIRAEQDISYGKASIVKACLLRKLKKSSDREVLTVALNEESNNKAYLLGRLFSILEKTQQDATPDINSTIKDRYFTSACATPGAVFPLLLRLSNHHIAKSKYGAQSSYMIKKILDRLDVENAPFPAHLPLEDQGLFILGYYHQNKAKYQANKKEEVSK